MSNIIKVGNKQKHVIIPDGYKLITDESFIIGKNYKDYMVLNVIKLHWEQLFEDDVYEEDIALPIVGIGEFVIGKI